MNKFCQNCGTPLLEGARFCGSCGQLLAQVIPATQPQQGVLTPAIPRTEKTSLIKNNGVYVAWFLFYFIVFSVVTAGIAIPFYIITVILAFTPLAEKLWRWVSGVRPLRLHSEQVRLLPLFKEVYTGAAHADANLSKGIRLYIKEDMTINAFAFGKSSLVITRGCLELLNDDCLKGLIAHEFGHFSYRHTEAILLATVSNFYISFYLSKLTDLKNRFDLENKVGIANGLLKFIVDAIYYSFKAPAVLGDLILMHTSRQHEYLADQFAEKSGFSRELTDALLEIYAVSISKPQSVKEQLKSSHPHITLRIERLEKALY